MTEWQSKEAVLSSEDHRNDVFALLLEITLVSICITEDARIC